MIKDGALYYYSASYFESGKADPREKRIRDAIPEDEKIQFGDRNVNQNDINC